MMPFSCKEGQPELTPFWESNKVPVCSGSLSKTYGDGEGAPKWRFDALSGPSVVRHCASPLNGRQMLADALAERCAAARRGKPNRISEVEESSEFEKGDRAD